MRSNGTLYPHSSMICKEAVVGDSWLHSCQNQSDVPAPRAPQHIALPEVRSAVVSARMGLPRGEHAIAIAPCNHNHNRTSSRVICFRSSPGLSTMPAGVWRMKGAVEPAARAQSWM